MIKVGVLCPYSSIYPNLHNDFTDSLRLALPKDYLMEYQFHFEYVASGSEYHVRQALEKLLHFERVDLITGFCNYKILDVLIDMIGKFDAIAMMADLGEIAPSKELLSDKVFFNSFSLWQTQYALGVWAHAEFENRGKGIICMSDYDAGYHINSSFTNGMGFHKATEIDLSIVPQSRAPRELMIDYFHEFVRMFKKEQPAFVHAIFAGQEAVDFMGVYHESGLAKEVPLLVTSHMGSDEILDKIRGGGLEFYNATVWNSGMQNKENLAFVQLFSSTFGGVPNIINLLGFEIGMALRETHHAVKSKNWVQLNQLLKNSSLRTPRGEKLFGWGDQNNKQVTIERVVGSNATFNRFDIQKLPLVSMNNTAMQKTVEENVSGYIHPYLCI